MTTSPLSMSAWVRVWVAVQLAGLAGGEGGEAAGQVTVTEGSVTVTPVRVTLPVLVTSKV